MSERKMSYEMFELKIQLFKYLKWQRMRQPILYGYSIFKAKLKSHHNGAQLLLQNKVFARRFDQNRVRKNSL